MRSAAMCSGAVRCAAQACSGIPAHAYAGPWATLSLKFWCTASSQVIPAGRQQGQGTRLGLALPLPVCAYALGIEIDRNDWLRVGLTYGTALRRTVRTASHRSGTQPQRSELRTGPQPYHLSGPRARRESSEHGSGPASAHPQLITSLAAVAASQAERSIPGGLGSLGSVLRASCLVLVVPWRVCRPSWRGAGLRFVVSRTRADDGRRTGCIGLTLVWEIYLQHMQHAALAHWRTGATGALSAARRERELVTRGCVLRALRACTLGRTDMSHA